MSENPSIPAPDDAGEFILYQTVDGRTRLEVRMAHETVWLSQKAMADLFQKDVRTINDHIRNIFEEEELREEAVVRKYRITAADGKTFDTLHYNLDVIIAVGYRVRSLRGLRHVTPDGVERLAVRSPWSIRADNPSLRECFVHAVNHARQTPDEKVPGFLRLSDQEILSDAGKISRHAAKEKAEAEFVLFKQQPMLIQPVTTSPQSFDEPEEDRVAGEPCDLLVGPGPLGNDAPHLGR